MRPLLRLLFGLCPTLAPAVVLTWDTSAQPGFQPGPGAWNDLLAWSSDGVGRTAWVGGADAVFRGSALGGTDAITLGLPVEVGDLTFGGTAGEVTRGAWLLTGMGLTLGRASRWDIGAGSSVQLLAPVFGVERWTKAGEGDLWLAGESLHRGGLTVESGGLVLRHALGAGYGPVDMAGGRLSLETGGILYNLLVLSAARVEVHADRVDAQAAPLGTTWAGVVSGTGMLVKTGRGELRLAGANTFSGGLTIAGGMVAVSQGTGLGRGPVRLAGGGVSLISNVTVTNAIEVVASASRLASSLNAQSQPFRATLAGPVSGVGSVVKVGAGTLWTTGSWAPQGGTVVQEGGLMANGQIEGAVRVEGGVLGGRGRAGAVVVAAGGVLAPGDGSGALTMSSLRVEAGARLVCAVERADLGPGSGHAFGLVEGRLDLAALGPTARARWVLGGKLERFDLTRDQSFVLWRYEELSLAPGIALPDCFELDASAWRAALGEDFDASWLGLSHDALSKTVSLVYASPVPEPSGYGLTLACGAGLWAFIRRVRRRWAACGRVTG